MAKLKKSGRTTATHQEGLPTEVPNMVKAAAIDISGGAWSAAPVSADPEIALSQWRVSEVTVRGRRERHVWGWNLTDREGRASMDVTGVDVATRIVTTSSGRRYRLVGPSGHDSDGEYVWTAWCRVNGAGDEVDVTAQLEAQLDTC